MTPARHKAILRLMLAGAAAAAPLSLAQAQSAPLAQFDNNVAREGLFTRDRNVSVRQRPHPDYAVAPKPVGAFDATPQVGVAVEGNDNIFAAPSGEEGDLILHVRPQVELRSGWSRHALNLFAAADVAQYIDNSSENVTIGTVGFNSRYDISRGTALQAGASISRDSEDRTSSGTPTGLEEPVQFNRTRVYGGGVKTFNRLRLSGFADYEGRRFDNGVAAGVPVRLDFRDVDIVRLTGRADYAWTPGLSVFTNAVLNQRNFPTIVAGVPSRDSEGYDITVGANFDQGGLYRGEFSLGYLNQDYETAPYEDVEGLSIHAELEYFVTQLTTVTLQADRGVEDSAVPLAGGFLFTGLTARVDHELLRNLIVSGQLVYQEEDFIGIARKDKVASAAVSANYLMNRNVILNASYQFYDRDSNGGSGGRTFDVNRVLVGLTYRF